MDESPKAKQIMLLVALFVIFFGVVLSVRAQRDEFRRAYISPRMAEQFLRDMTKQEEINRAREERSRQLMAMIDAQSEVQAQKYRSPDAGAARRSMDSSPPYQPAIELKGFEPVPSTIIESETHAPVAKQGEIRITATLSDDSRTIVTGAAVTLEEAVRAATDSTQKIKFIVVSTDEGAALDAADFEFLRLGLSTSADRNIVSIDLSRAEIFGDRLPDGALRNARESVFVKLDAESEWRKERLLPSLEEQLREYDARRSEAEERILVSYYIVQPYTTAIYGPLDNLAEVALPPGIQSIGERAFEDCASLTAISAPDAEAVGASAFRACLSLVSADLRKALTLGPSAFEACIKLTDANFSNARDVGNRAFYLCESLFEIDMPLAETIRDSAFERSALIAANLPKVREVGAKAFFYCKYLRRIRIQSAESVGAESFMYCYRLESISMPMLSAAGGSAFRECENLSSVSLPNLTKVSNNLFQECFALKNAILPRASDVGECAFLKCGSMESATLPSVENFARGAFSGCASLKFLIVGRTLPRLPERVFENVPDGVTIYATNDSSLPLYYPDSFVKKNYDELTSDEIMTPFGVEMLRGYQPPAARAEQKTAPRVAPEAALHKPKPHEISVALLKPDGAIALAATGDSLESAFESAISAHSVKASLESCDALYIATGDATALGSEDFVFIRQKLSQKTRGIRLIDLSLARLEKNALPSEAFQNMTLEKLHSSRPSDEARRVISARGGLDNLQIVVLPTKGSVITIGPWAFAGCGKLTDVLNTGFVERVGNCAFLDCASLEELRLPRVHELSDRALSKCNSLVSVRFPMLSDLGASAFQYCSLLASVDLPNASSIGISSFALCPNFKHANIPNVRTVGRDAFTRCISLRSLSLPNATHVGMRAFSGCETLRSVSMPLAKSIEPKTFNECVLLETVSAASAESVGANAFWKCRSLKYAVLPNVRTIGEHAFSGSRPTSLHVPDAYKIGLNALPNTHLLELPLVDTYTGGQGGREGLYIPNVKNIREGERISPIAQNLVAPRLEKLPHRAAGDWQSRNIIVGDLATEKSEAFDNYIYHAETSARGAAGVKIFAAHLPKEPLKYGEALEYIEYDELPQPKIGIFPEKTSLRVGESTETHVRPRAVCMAAISTQRYWSTDRPDVIDVADDGTVTALAPGTADLWCIVSTDVIITTKQGEPEVFSGWPVSAKATVEVLPR